MSWNDLAKQYRDRGLVLALGAGISLGSGIPTWGELLRRIARSIARNKTRGDNLINELTRYGFSFPAIASVLEGMCRDDSFKEKVRKELYRTFPFRRGLTRHSSSRFVQYIKTNNSTLASVAAICAIRREASNDFERNTRIHAIVNFNLDSILRAYMHERYRAYLLRSVERASKTSDLRKTNVYYMHGFLRFDLKENNPAEEAADKMVLTEREYFDFFNRPTGLFNYAFLYLLREYSTLFVGLSLIDENIRRLLHYSRAEREAAYREEGRLITPTPPRHFAIFQRSHSELDKLLENSVGVLGVSVLWVNNYAEIPVRFEQLYTTGGGNWADTW